METAFIDKEVIKRCREAILNDSTIKGIQMQMAYLYQKIPVSRVITSEGKILEQPPHPKIAELQKRDRDWETICI